MRVVDFDAFRAEQAKDPILLRANGRDFKLPPSIPAALALDIARLHDLLGDGTDISPAELQRLGAGLFGGSEAFHYLLAEGGITMEELPDLLRLTLHVYSGAPDPNAETRPAEMPDGMPSTS